MSHPNHEELTEFLYDELSPTRQAEVASHVESCDACRATIETWRSVRTNLAEWKLPATSMPTAPRRSAIGALRWAVAAVVLLACGYGFARMTANAVDPAVLRADLVREVREEVRQELTTELASHNAKQEQWQQGFQDAVVDVIRTLETRQVASQASLRKDLETVAFYTQEQVGRLANETRDESEATEPVQQ